MTKHDFLLLLRDRLSSLPQQEIDEQIAFWGEMIDDRMEEGLSEAVAVAAIGSLDGIAAQILAERVAEPAAPSRKPWRPRKTWEIVLLALGSPVWLSLGIAALAVVFSMYAVLWSLIAAIWSCFAAVVACAPGGVVGGIVRLAFGAPASGLLLLGAGVFCAGFAIVLYFGCVRSTLALVNLTKTVARAIRQAASKKEVAQ